MNPPTIYAPLSHEEMDALLSRVRIEEIGAQLQRGFSDLGTRRRSPSPPPIYDEMGRRVNTHEQRERDRLLGERQRIVEHLKSSVWPSYRPPPDYRPLTTQKTRKIYVPVKEFPDYNFIGLIIGPRGLTQKQMERETGAKISLRGRGSVREGKGRVTTRDNTEDEDLHVVITGDTEEVIDHAERLVRRLLVPIEEGKNDIKREQLRKLAELNGTLRNHERDDDHYGEMSRWSHAANVICTWCGDVSHTSNDCTLRGTERTVTLQSVSEEVRRAYVEFMGIIGIDVTSEIANQAAPDDDGLDEDAKYRELLASVGAVP